MHADVLYQRMLAQEKSIEDAKRLGQPIPQYLPVLSSAKKDLLIEDRLKISDYSPEVQKAYQKRLQGLEGEERVLEEKALQAELQSTQELRGNLSVVWAEQAKAIKEREQHGTSTIADKARSIIRR